MCKQACILTRRDKYYTEFFRTITYCNECNGAPLSNEKIQYAIHKFITEEEADTHNITVDTFRQTSNTQIENGNTILTSDKRYKLDVLEKKFNAGYYE